MNDRQRLEAIIEVLGRYLPPDGPLTEHEAMNEIIGLVDPLPPAPVAEIREPTPEECTDMAEWFKSECAACCINPQESADYGRAIFDAVKIVMWPKDGL